MTVITHLLEWLIATRWKIMHIAGDVEKTGPLHTVGEKCKWVGTLDNMVWSFLKNYYWQSTIQSVSQGNEIKMLKTYLHSHVHLSIIHNSICVWRASVCICIYTSIQWLVNVTYVHTQIHTAFQKRNPIIFDMSEPRGHYGKWNKPGSKRQMLHNLTYMWNLKKPTPH